MTMTRSLAAFAASAVALFSTGLPVETPARADEIQMTPLFVEVLSPPTPVKGADSAYHLVYELRLANASPVDLELLEVATFGNGAFMSGLSGKELAARFGIGGRRGAESSTLTVGQFGVLFLHIGALAETAVPASIAHRITLRRRDTGKDFTISAAGQSAVNKATDLVLGSPLRGEGYLAGDGCCDTIRHVRALLPLNGRFALAQRFAIDWEQVGPDQRLVHGDKPDIKDVKSYNVYGKPVYAVADGTVIFRRDDLPDQMPGKLPDGLPIDEADGNHVVLKLDERTHALYAHLQRKDVAMPGAVKKGAVLGYVGNSGNTSAPHLHFHVMDGPSPLLSNGLPYLIAKFTMTAIDEQGTADFDRAEATGVPLTLTAREPKPKDSVLPMDLMVVDFPSE
jgi:peptidase M23-like protein